MSRSMRIKGGLIDRSAPLNFSFNGHDYHGYAGDTVASALLANDVHLVARSFKYHRPRGILTSGAEEPNALMTIGAGDDADPNTRATIAELYDNMIVKSQNHVGSLNFDLMAINDWLSPFLSAGFYYKTFMWPAAFWEKFYEPVIRRAAGLGALSGNEDPSLYDKGYRHADLLVIGGGVSGLMSALLAGRAGLRVILADEDFRFGGNALAMNGDIDSKSYADWINDTLDELAHFPHVTLMPRSTVFGVFDHGTYGVLENLSDHLPKQDKPPYRQIMWKIMAKRAILASGALERPVAFADNDRPGIMLSGAVREYANRYAVATGNNVAIMTNNDSGIDTAIDLLQAGVNVTALIDSRASAESHQNLPKDIRLIAGDTIARTSGRKRIRSVTLESGAKISADCLAVSGGWSPALHLTCHHRGRPVWNDDIVGFVPGGDLPPGLLLAGSVTGAMSTKACLDQAVTAVNTALKDLGKKTISKPKISAEDKAYHISPLWQMGSNPKARKFVDLQNDVSSKDIKLAHQEGYRSVEHLKRYTTMGMATDQGKTSNVLGLAIMAEQSGRSIADTGTTIFRPPYTPVPIGAFAGRSRGKAFRPIRLAPSHQWAKEHNADFVEAGAWLRAQWFTRKGETHWRQSVDREVLATRSAVGICDVSTLGKIDIQGRDATAFVNLVYANGFAKLPVGKTRYGLMLREDGFVMDDGTTARLGDNHYVMTTTTANAVLVYRHLEFCRQGIWPDLDVQLISTTEQYAQYAIAGPEARQLLNKIVDNGVDISDAAFPFMACGEISICNGIKARLFRISFSGELAYELAVPARYGDALIRLLMDIGQPLGITPYGTEALGVMRIEKGHPAGNELNGQTSAHHLGMGRMLNPNKDFIGKVMAMRPELTRDDGVRLVGLKPVDPNHAISAGAHIVAIGAATTSANDQGWVSSVAWSPMMQTSIALGFVTSGNTRYGEVVRAADPLRGNDVEVEIVSPHFFDPEGRRLHG
ncbi:MAG: sarcosine oxidase subunit alpha family protein [Alphaproteobacteria bacterium]|nr:sarcosine oxidase subunit alpha family protein [Alphaproteobacteria bacterium]